MTRVLVRPEYFYSAVFDVIQGYNPGRQNPPKLRAFVRTSSPLMLTHTNYGQHGHFLTGSSTSRMG